jgi:hypothetical protein
MWNWQNISDDLPGQDIYQMWIGNIGEIIPRHGRVAEQINILRVAIPQRGV